MNYIEMSQQIIGFEKSVTQHKLELEEIQRYYDIQNVVNTLLRFSLENNSLEKILKYALDLILSISWLTFESKGCIFLVENDPDVLIMKVQNGIPEPLGIECARVPFGKCLCGKAASTQEVQFADCLDARHEIIFGGITPHGHYCVPITYAGRTRGVINIYIREGHSRNQIEEGFLISIADTLAGVVERKLAEDALLESEKKLRVQSRELMESNTALKVLLGQVEDEKRAVEDVVLLNVKNLILPYVEKLKKSRSGAEAFAYWDILESNLNEITSPFSLTLSSKHLGFTPREIQIANLIKEGKQGKEIAEMLNISLETVKSHRQTIRKKLGIYSKKTNLRTYLLSQTATHFD